MAIWALITDLLAKQLETIKAVLTAALASLPPFDIRRLVMDSEPNATKRPQREPSTPPP